MCGNRDDQTTLIPVSCCTDFFFLSQSSRVFFQTPSGGLSPKLQRAAKMLFDETQRHRRTTMASSGQHISQSFLIRHVNL